jgi:hypothetical protein
MRKNISTANINQPTVSLFDQVSEKSGRYDIEVPTTPAWLLTNRNNLLEILSTGLIKPASLYTKYYPDPGQFCPYSIPILFRAPTIELTNLFMADDETLFPVLLELDLRGLTGLCQIINEDYSIHEGQIQLLDSSALCMVLNGCLPGNCITSAIFRSHLEIKEFQLRKYDNVPDGILPLDIKPELFQGNLIDSQLFIEVLKKVESLGHGKSDDFPKIIDSLGGSLIMLSSLASRSPKFPLDALASCLRLFQNPQGINKHVDLKNISEKFPWLLELVSIFPENYPDFFQAEISKEVKKIIKSLGTNPEESIFQIAVKQLAWLSLENFANESIVEDIFNEFSKEHNDSSVINKYKELFTTIRNVLVGEIALDRYLEQYRLSEFPVSGAFMYFLLRNKPRDVFSLANDGFEQNVSLLARVAVLSGVLYGRATISVDCYPGLDLKKYLDYIIAQHFNIFFGSIKMKELPDLFEIREEKSIKPEKQELINSETVLISRILINEPVQPVSTGQTKVKKGPQSSNEESKAINPAKGPKKGTSRKTNDTSHEEKLVTEITQAADKNINFVKLKKLILDADLFERDRAETIIAIEICRLAGWNEVVSTVIPVSNADFLLEYRKERMEFRMPGFVTPIIRIKPEEFKKRLVLLTEKQLEQYYTQGLKTYVDKLEIP